MGSRDGHRGNGPRRLEGTVAAVNERGLRLEGRDCRPNYSKWAGDLTPPARGQVVALTLDGSGFVRAVGPADGAALPMGNAHGGVSTTVDTDAGPSKDATITRLAVLKAANSAAAGRPDVKSGDVLRIAEVWEKWVVREEP